MTQSELAEAAGLSQSAIANYERGARGSPRNILALAAALDVDPNWLGTGAIDTQANDWPFPSIDPQTYKNLDQKTKTLIENTVAAIIKDRRP